ncbi:barstar family protein [Roseateles depolymerans]|uniref:barstar family protein n=1 Tax=Roseateles depolymerans TaxID=76731 RepID=UPI000E366175|nr:barstar family protein [Roseateles depolymerans]REG22177.1 ribonuclease inhibitor [Roseateles depolymerans]
MHLIIDGSIIESEEDLHNAIADGLNLPSWYGKNIDALWDALTGMVGRPLKITWINADQSKRRLPRFEKYLSLLQEVAEQDRQLKRPDFLKLEIR